MAAETPDTDTKVDVRIFDFEVRGQLTGAEAPVEARQAVDTHTAAGSPQSGGTSRLGTVAFLGLVIACRLETRSDR